MTIEGTVNNTGTTFDLSTLAPSTGSILLNVGTINGEPSAAERMPRRSASTGTGTFNGATLATPLTMTLTSPNLEFLNGLTLNSTITIASAAN